MTILSPDQLHDYCLEVAKCPAFLDELKPYAKQALEQYAKEQQNTKFFSEELRTYYRAMPNNIYEAADAVLALLDSSVEKIIVQPSDKNKRIRKAQSASLRENFEVSEIKELISFLFAKSAGARAAVLLALNTRGVLTGNPYDLHDWFTKQIGEKISRETIAKTQNELDNYGEILSATAQKVYNDAISVIDTLIERKQRQTGKLPELPKIPIR